MAKKVRLTPEEYADKWQRRMTTSTDDIRKGVERVTESPGRAAAQNMDKMKNNWLNAFNSGKIKRGLESFTVDQWKEAFLTKGLNRISDGVMSATQKQIDFSTKLFAHQNQLLNEVNQIKVVTKEDAVNKMVAWCRGMMKFSKN